MNLDEDLIPETKNMELTDGEIFTKIWTSPRLVFRYLNDTRYDVGLKQNKESVCLEPRLAWFITHKNQINEKPVSGTSSPLIYANLTQVPDDIWELKSIDELTLNFIGKINIPDKISTLNLTYL